jgi:hypothetical protein
LIETSRSARAQLIPISIYKRSTTSVEIGLVEERMGKFPLKADSIRKLG